MSVPHGICAWTLYCPWGKTGSYLPRIDLIEELCSWLGAKVLFPSKSKFLRLMFEAINDP